MEHPVNPRGHGPQASPYYNPYQRSHQELDENDPRSQTAQAVFKDFRNGYANAKHANSVAFVAKPKFRGADSGTVKPTRKINVVVRKITNCGHKGTITPFNVQMVSYEETRLWTDVENNIFIYLDGIYSQEHSYRLQSCDDFSLYYMQGRCIIDSISKIEGTTLRDIWDASTIQPGLFVQLKHVKTMTLELEAYVKYPPKGVKSSEDIDDDTSDYPSETDSTVRLYKRPNSNSRYNSKIVSLACPVPNSNQERFTVKKLTVSLDGPSGEAIWDESTETFTVLVDKIKFSSRKTKNAFKLRFTHSSTYYAAKSFYDVGYYSAPSKEENLQHLKEELIRQLTIREVVSEFSRVAKNNNIPIYDLQMADSFILLVSNGPESGTSWLVDHLLDHQKMRKFSGTDSTGTNNDFAGKTCDAFAHFALIDSKLEFVPADIQEIDTQVIKDCIRAANAITLFDVMAHSVFCTMGLGDKGVEGMKMFCMQHKCNAICKKLKLVATSKFIDQLKSPEESDGLLGVAADDGLEDITHDDGDMPDEMQENVHEDAEADVGIDADIEADADADIEADTDGEMESAVQNTLQEDDIQNEMQGSGDN
ncbi:kinase-like domain-containing protein [Cyathus striatus]|nr:kinase-like domain-containing protein [Cyathus striatus]